MTSVPPRWRADTSLLDALGAAVVATDLHGEIFYCNALAEELYCYSRAEMLAANVMDLLIPSDGHPLAGDIVAHVQAGQRWAGEFLLRCGDGRLRRVQLTGSPLYEDGRVVGILGVGEDLTEFDASRSAATTLSARLNRLAHVTAELAAAQDVNTVKEIVLSHAADAVGATMASLTMLVDDSTLALVGFRGENSQLATAFATIPLAARVPSAEAVRTGKRVVVEGVDAIEARFPGQSALVPGERTVVALPLVVGERPLGAIGLSFPGIWPVDDQELEFFGTLADTCAQALDRLQALADAADRAAKLSFLAGASAELASSLDYRVTLSNVARLAVPTLADWCAVQVVDDGHLHTLAVAHTDPEKVALAERLQKRYPPDPGAPAGAPNVARTGVSELVADITDEMLVASARDEEHLRLARALKLRSALVVPLIARQRVLGVITLVSAESDRRYDQADLAFAENLAHRAAVAIDNALLHSETREASVRLQRAVSPERLTQVPGFDLAGHYRPAGRTEVGGDFYDAVGLSNGRVAVFMGDVMGRGVAAAAAMAQVRSALRAYLVVDDEPAAVMHNLDLMFNQYDIAQLVTLVYLVIDPSRDELRMVNAGHPPPLVIRSDSVEQLPLAGSPPFGTGDAERATVRVPFHVGETLLAYTDGLVERRTEGIDVGLDRLLGQAGRLRRPGLSGALVELVDAMHDDTREDDVAALAVRRLSLS
jgi:PAS domain S-box-containing protein